MKGLKIFEIEDSYLNFFTPALMCAASLFLLMVISHSLSLTYVILNVNTIYINYIVSILAGILIFVISNNILIPKLKIRDSEFTEPNRNGFFLVIFVFSIIITIRILLESFYNILDLEKYMYTPWYVSSYTDLYDPAILMLFLVNRLLVSGLISVFLYQRILIPLLEDRGLSPFISVLIVSISFAMLDIPLYFQIPNMMNNIFWFISTFLFSFATGIIYILTRNIGFSILYGSVYQLYKIINEIAVFLNDPLFLSIYEVIDGVLLFTCVIILLVFFIFRSKINEIPVWKKTLTRKSYGLINKGIVGFFIISFYLVIIQFIIDNLSSSLLDVSIELYLLFTACFYLIAFSIPWWLSISTEYAQDIE